MEELDIETPIHLEQILIELLGITARLQKKETVLAKTNFKQGLNIIKKNNITLEDKVIGKSITEFFYDCKSVYWVEKSINFVKSYDKNPILTN